jgi:uncharacterized membrane protein (DUF2068 family)
MDNAVKSSDASLVSNMAKPTTISPGQLKGLRAVATLEFSKGIAAIVLAFWLVSILKTDIPGRAVDAAMRILDLLHVAPGGRFATRLLSRADALKADEVAKLAAIGFGYSVVRFAEAYGLWNARAWAEWFALLGGAAYLPLEIYEIIRHATWVRWTVLIVNVAIVIYMAYVRMTAQE